jgi:hypothetical protein
MLANFEILSPQNLETALEYTFNIFRISMAFIFSGQLTPLPRSQRCTSRHVVIGVMLALV